MNNKSYLEKIVRKEYINQSKKNYLQKLISEEYTKILGEDSAADNSTELSINKNNWLSILMRSAL